MTISQSKIGEIKKSAPGGTGQQDISKHAFWIARSCLNGSAISNFL
jgi:hypothetical protein